MGDRTYVTLIVGPNGMFDADNALNAETCDLQEDGTYLLECTDMDYGGTSVLEQLAKAGILFFGEHGAGHDYGRNVLVSIDGQLVTQDTCDGDQPYVPVGDDGTICEEQLEEARAFVALRNRVKEILKRPTVMSVELGPWMQTEPPLAGELYRAKMSDGGRTTLGAKQDHHAADFKDSLVGKTAGEAFEMIAGRSAKQEVL